jgi:hypothetical protein
MEFIYKSWIIQFSYVSLQFLFGTIDMNIYPLKDVPVHNPQQNEDNI